MVDVRSHAMIKWLVAGDAQACGSKVGCRVHGQPAFPHSLTPHSEVPSAARLPQQTEIPGSPKIPESIKKPDAHENRRSWNGSSESIDISSSEAGGNDVEAVKRKRVR